MKTKIRKVMALCLCAVLVGMFSTTAFAADIPYRNYYHSGNENQWFSMISDRNFSQFTVETQDFPSTSGIAVEVWDSSKTTRLSKWTVYISGNNKVSNQPLFKTYGPGTYNIKYSVQPNSKGWIGVWLY